MTLYRLLLGAATLSIAVILGLGFSNGGQGGEPYWPVVGLGLVLLVCKLVVLAARAGLRLRMRLHVPARREDRMKEEPMKDYYYQPTNLWRKLRCAFRLIPLFVGHDFDIQYTKERSWASRRKGQRVGEAAYVCRLCFRVEDRRDYEVLPEISYGSSPSTGRHLERRVVDHLPIAPVGQEPLCGMAAPAYVYQGSGSARRVRCRKFEWHNRSADHSMRVHDSTRPAPGGTQSFMWDDPVEVTA